MTPRENIPPPPPQRPASRSLWWALPALTLAWAALIAISAAAFVRMPLWEVAPGSAAPVAPRISLDDRALAQVTRHRSPSPILFVTALGSRLSALDAVVGLLDDDVEVQTYRERFGDRTPAQQQQAGVQAMITSKQIAEYVAFRRLGLDVDFEWGDVVVSEVVCESSPSPESACRRLRSGDVLRSLDGRPLTALPDLVDALANRSPGDLVTLGVSPGGSGSVESRDVRLIASPDDPTRTILGIVPVDTRRVNLPFEVSIDTDRIGGPSAGLAFTLALLDELTPGDLMGGQRVAATGTINPDESVGAIGALRQKAIAVKAAGATLFFVPMAQSEAEIASAQRAVGDGLRIVPVATLDEALAVLRELGGDPLGGATTSL
jgi:PDZ domain-containing protein